MPVNEKLVREAIEQLEARNYRRCRTLLEEAVRTSELGLWAILTKDGLPYCGKVYSKEGYMRNGIRQKLVSREWSTGVVRIQTRWMKGEDIMLQLADGTRVSLEDYSRRVWPDYVPSP